MPRGDEPLDPECAAAKAAVLPRLTDGFLETLTLAAMAMDGDDLAEGIAFRWRVTKWLAKYRRNSADSSIAIDSRGPYVRTAPRAQPPRLLQRATRS